MHNLELLKEKLTLNTLIISVYFMIKNLLSIFCFFFAFQSFSQEKEPDSEALKSPESLAKFLCKEAKNDSAKVDEIYTWITENVAYNYAQTESDKCFEYESAEKVLKSRTALCTGYVRLMTSMLDAVNIESVFVPGYTYAHKQFYKPEVLLDNHAWLAIKVGGKWQMADPTWDAGYIGSLEAQKLKEKLEKKNIKIAEKNEKRLAKDKDTIPTINIDSVLSAENPTGKMGFIAQPSKKWFLSNQNAFLLRHLPANPMWQLRINPISTDEFLMPDSTLKSILASTSNINGDEDFSLVCDQFLELNFLEQILFMGEDAYAYYPNNKRLKAYYYYYYLTVLNDKEVRKQIKELDDIQTSRLNGVMRQSVDTALLYSKESEKIEKDRYKELQNFFKQVDKENQNSNRYFVKMADKGLRWNDKMIEGLEKRKEKLISENEKLEKECGGLPMPSENELNWQYSNYPEETKVLIDSINSIKNTWQAFIDTWQNHLENPPLVKAYNFVLYNTYLLQQRSIYLGHKSISFNDYIDTVDYIITHNIDSLDRLYDKDLEEEMLQDDAYKMARELQSYKSYMGTQLSDLIEQGVIEDMTPYLSYLENTQTYMQLKQAEYNQQAQSHNEWLFNNIINLSDEWLEFEKLSKEQEKLTEKKNEYLVEQAEHTHKREEDLSETIQEKVKAWSERIGTD